MSAPLPTPPRMEPADRGPRWSLIRDLLVFEAKMLIEGLRDLLVVPLALVAALADLVFNSREEGRFFYAVMQAGQRFDRWLNLFGHAPETDEAPGGVGLDGHLRRLEELLLEQHRSGGVTAQAQRRIDALLDRVGEAGRSQGPR